ncbi:Uma2 family endonuclease [Limnothrix sp. FACHB-881]|uniref:Uma2 family endonuclease n=1 Tax=Limnothrix sp. FACHB-881 TaxID=2692819 RepID=UPI0016835ACE|nr:Uma2 family endonuclease [Limnothrix sp. FACHB-881]MBD2635627.1 Uma2 family endonuclease [Limnothrix sp. FACHB-881]
MLPSFLESLPNADELPDSCDIPVDNEDQNFIPNVLLFLLEYIWKHREDWFFAVDMGVYHATGPHPKVPVIPDGFLSLGVDRRKNGKPRRSYITWTENNIPPILTLEVVSYTPGEEYDEKMAIYARLGVLYYVIYNPEFWRRDGHLPLEVYKLVEGTYQLQVGEPCWMPEIGLGIGRDRLVDDPFDREVLTWCDAQGRRYRSEAEVERDRAAAERQRAATEAQRADEAQQRADEAQQRADRLAERLRELGIDPEAIESD